MEITIRDFTPADYPAAAAVRSAALPQDPASAAQLAEWDEHRPEGIRRRRWVAERDGQVVGTGEYTQSTDMYHPRAFQLIVFVHPRHQGVGAGSKLYDHLMRELQPFEPITYQARAYEADLASRRFLAQRGFVEVFRQWESHLDTGSFPAERWRPVEDRLRHVGVSIVTLADLEGDPDRDRRLYDLELELEADVPSPDPVRKSLWPRDGNRYRRYVDRVLHHPDRAPWSYLVAVKEGEYVGLSYGSANHATQTFDIDMTGVREPYRGLGIATALKVRGIVEARARGITTIRTWNDTANDPILGLNEKLGFIPQPSLMFFERQLSTHARR